MLLHHRRLPWVLLAPLLLWAACKGDRDDSDGTQRQYLAQRAMDDPRDGPLQDRDRPIDAAVYEWLSAGLTEEQIRKEIAEGLQHNVLIAPMQPNGAMEKKLLTAGASVELIEYMKSVQPPDDAYHPRERQRLEEVVVDWLGRGMSESEIRDKLERGLRTGERLRPIGEDEQVLTTLREAGASEELLRYLVAYAPADEPRTSHDATDASDAGEDDAEHP